MIKVRKYNKKLQPFDKNKIIESIQAASSNCEQEMPLSKSTKIAEAIENELMLNDAKIVTTDNIATVVEQSLMKSSYKQVAKAYITYRHDKQQEHVYNSDLIKAFKKKLNGVSIENANANSDERSFSGRMNEASRVLLKDDALNLMSKQFKNNHINNRVYTHDLDSYSSGSHNCLSIPFDNMFKDGVAIKQTDIRQPKNINTAFQLIAVYMQVQSLQQFGGVSATHIDWTLVPYVRYSLIKNLTEVIAYEKDTNDKDIEALIETKLLSLNKVPYCALSKKALHEEIFKILSNNSYDFINALDTIADDIMENS